MARPAARLILIILAAGMAGFTPSRAVAQVVRGRDTASVEILGLSRWTRAMLEDSLRVRAPSVALASAASARALRDALGFVDAEATEFYWQDDEGQVRGPVFVLAVREPQHARPQWNEPSGAGEQAVTWPSIIATLTDSSGLVDDIALGAAVSGYSPVRELGADSAFALAVRADPAGAFRAVKVWRALSGHTRAGDLQRAVATLERHTDPAHRLAAIGVLQNFPRHDRAWHAMVRALSDPHPYVRGVAIQSLSAMAYHQARTVDWSPAAADLRALLGGTNLSAFIRLMVALDQTRIDRRVAPMLLAGGNAELVLAHAGSSVHMVRQAAWNLLGRLSGRPAAGVDTWRRWAEGLEAPFLRRTQP